MTDHAAIMDPRLLLLAPEDNVCVACVALDAGVIVMLDGAALSIHERIELGHKIARMPIVAGEPVRKYGAPIGNASRAIARGEHVHTHNLRSNYLPTYTLDGSNPFVRAER